MVTMEIYQTSHNWNQSRLNCGTFKNKSYKKHDLQNRISKTYLYPIERWDEGDPATIWKTKWSRTYKSQVHDAWRAAHIL